MMKYTFRILFLLFSLQGTCQQRIISYVNIATKKGDSTGQAVLCKALFTMKDGTQNFRAKIELSPVINNLKLKDSLRLQNKSTELLLEGQFPVNNINFLSPADNGKEYEMEVAATINDSTLKDKLKFSLAILKNETVDPNGNSPRYPARIYFDYLLQPEIFGLNAPPYNINQLLLLQVRNAIINKTDY